MSPLTLDIVRDRLTEVLADIRRIEVDSKPPVVQEVILARRSAEDARMRLGVASAMEKGHDPWVSKVEDK